MKEFTRDITMHWDTRKAIPPNRFIKSATAPKMEVFISRCRFLRITVHLFRVNYIRPIIFTALVATLFRVNDYIPIAIFLFSKKKIKIRVV